MNLLYVVLPTMLILIVLAAVWLDRWSVPVILVALGGGVLFGSDVLGLWSFSDELLANNVANAALVFILFQGGFSTKHDDLKPVALPAIGLATWGVLLTAVITFLALWKGLGWSADKAGLLAVIISSTDAAATFSILRRQSLPQKLSSTIEIESAANDPMAVLLTVVVVQSLAMGAAAGWETPLVFLWKFTAGPLTGWLMGHGALWLFNHLRPQDRGYYYVLFLGVVLLTFGLAEGVRASGMLAVFIAGYVMGNHPFVHKQGVAHFSSAFSSVANIGTFVLLGLLVFPSQLEDIWMEGLILFGVLTFIARPAAVWLGTLGMRLKGREKGFIMWAGLRGAVPVVLATYPAAAGLEHSQEIFNLVFFAVILSILVQGSSLGGLARLLKLSARPKARPLYDLELLTMTQSEMDLMTVEIPESANMDGPKIQELHLPVDTVIMMVTRGEKVISPLGQTRLHSGDFVTVLTHVKNGDAVREALTAPFMASLPTH